LNLVLIFGRLELDNLAPGRTGLLLLSLVALVMV
jgi:hypothetical protein